MAETVFIPNLLVGAEWEAAPETHALIQEIGDKVAEVAKTLAPVETGALRDSIHVEPGGLVTAEARIIADVRYAAFVEFGTSEMSAEPYLAPALEAVTGG